MIEQLFTIPNSSFPSYWPHVKSIKSFNPAFCLWSSFNVHFSYARKREMTFLFWSDQANHSTTETPYKHHSDG